MSRLTETERALAELALGTLEGEERETALARLRRSPALGPLRAAWEAELAALADAVPDAEPPDALFGAIEAAIDRESPDGTRTVRRDGGRWVERSPGIWQKMLRHDPDTGRRTYLLHCEAGAVVPSHAHRHDEELMILEGSIALGGLLLTAGDFHVARAGSDHVDAVTRDGCLVLVRC